MGNPAVPAAPAAGAPPAGAPAAPAAPAAPTGGLPSEADLHAALGSDDEPGDPSTPAGSATLPAGAAAAPADDPDGDAAFSKEFAEGKLPEGLKKRISALTEQRNAAREQAKGVKDFEFFKPYANDKGKAYLSDLVKFDAALEKAVEAKPWLGDLLRAVVLQGGNPDAKVLAAIQQAVGNPPAAPGAQPKEPGMGEDDDLDPVAKEVRELREWRQKQEEKEKQAAEEAKRRQEVDSEKETIRAEMKSFYDTPEGKPFKEDQKFHRMALRQMAATNSSFTDAAKEVSAYLLEREDARLKSLANAGKEGAGAVVETPGRGGVPKESMPALDSPEHRKKMLEYYGVEE